MAGRTSAAGIAPSTNGDGCWQEAGAEHLTELVRKSRWALVEFWAPDCVFSRLMKPIRDRLERRRVDGLLMRRCRVSWEDVRLDDAWGVTALPALILFHRGRRVARWIGSTDPCLVADRIDARVAESTGERS